MRTKDRHQDLVAQANFYADSIIDTLREPLLILAPDFKVLRANHAFYETFKRRPEGTESFSLFKLDNGRWDIPELRRHLEELSGNQGDFNDVEVSRDFGAAGRRVLLLNGKRIGTRAAKNRMIFLAMEDITARKQVEETLTELSLTDELTHLYNRRGFLTLAEDRLKLARRTKNDLWLFFADVDGLKSINDTYGHQEGDAALVEIAQVLRRTFRESDIIARLAGDEFTILASSNHPDYGSIVSARLEENLAAVNRLRIEGHRLSISMGAGHFPGGGLSSLEEMMEKTDEKLYKIKNDRKAGTTNAPDRTGGENDERQS